jgi:hypothetical protein
MAKQTHRQIFLSHAGEDADLALRFAAQIKDTLLKYRRSDIEVFCTSTPAHRFKDLKEGRWMGLLSRAEVLRWEEELRQYLRQNILHSVVYVLLVTKQSLAKNSRWIAFEIEVGIEQNEAGNGIFIPCLAEEVSSGELPEEVRRRQALQLDTERFQRDIGRLVKSLLDNGNFGDSS